MNLAVLEILNKNYDPAKENFSQALLLARENNQTAVLISILNNFANLEYILDNYAAAKRYLDESVQLSAENGSRRELSHSQVHLANIAIKENDLDEAEKLLLDSLQLRKNLDFSWGIANSLRGLGELKDLQGDFKAAHSYFKDALTITIESKNQWEIIALNSLIGQNLVSQEAYEAAAQQMIEVLNTGIDHPEALVEIFLGSARLILDNSIINEADKSFAFELFGFVQGYEKSTAMAVNRAETLADQYAQHISAELATAKLASGKSLTLDKVKQKLQHLLSSFTDDTNISALAASQVSTELNAQH